MGDLVGVTLVKRFSYRGDASEEFSNTYHLTGAIPADGTAWGALVAALITQEKTVYPASVGIVRAYGYNSDAADAHAVYSFDYAAAGAVSNGSLAVGAGIQMPGDVATWLRWKTSRTNSRGKPIYLRKYFHAALVNPAPDTVLAAQKTALEALGTKLMDGSFLDGRKVRSRTHDETILSRAASTYATTRTLKRRGKRPS